MRIEHISAYICSIKSLLEKKLLELEDHPCALFLYGFGVTNFSPTKGCFRCHSNIMHI